MSVKAADTIREYLNEYNKQPLRMTEYFLKELLKDNDVKEFYNEENIVDYHDSYIKEIKVRYNMTNEEFRKYRCNPWRMAHDLYGNTELWFMLLHLNEMYSATEFTRKSIYVFNTSIIERLSEIKSARSDIIRENENIIFNAKKEIIEGTDGMWD